MKEATVKHNLEYRLLGQHVVMFHVPSCFIMSNVQVYPEDGLPDQQRQPGDLLSCVWGRARVGTVEQPLTLENFVASYDLEFDHFGRVQHA